MRPGLPAMLTVTVTVTVNVTLSLALALTLTRPDQVRPGLPAMHTVDEALLCRAFVLSVQHGEGSGTDAGVTALSELVVVTSEYHAARAEHLFGPTRTLALTVPLTLALALALALALIPTLALALALTPTQP